MYKPTPLHNWTSHGADSFRYGAVGSKSLRSGNRHTTQQFAQSITILITLTDIASSFTLIPTGICMGTTDVRPKTQENESERIGRILREQKHGNRSFRIRAALAGNSRAHSTAQCRVQRTVQKGGKRTEKAIDATGALALQKFGAAIESVITPRTQKWHTLSNERFANDEEVQRYSGRFAIFSSASVMHRGLISPRNLMSIIFPRVHLGPAARSLIT